MENIEKSFTLRHSVPYIYIYIYTGREIIFKMNSRRFFNSAEIVIYIFCILFRENVFALRVATSYYVSKIFTNSNLILKIFTFSE